MDFVLGTTPARRIKRRRATPPNLGGEFQSDASRHSGNLIAPAVGLEAASFLSLARRATQYRKSSGPSVSLPANTVRTMAASLKDSRSSQFGPGRSLMLDPSIESHGA